MASLSGTPSLISLTDYADISWMNFFSFQCTRRRFVFFKYRGWQCHSRTMFDNKENTALFSFSTSAVNPYRLSHQHRTAAEEPSSRKWAAACQSAPPPKYVGEGVTNAGSHHCVQLCFMKCSAIYLLATGRDDVIWSKTERKDVSGMKPLSLRTCMCGKVESAAEQQNHLWPWWIFLSGCGVWNRARKMKVAVDCLSDECWDNVSCSVVFEADTAAGTSFVWLWGFVQCRKVVVDAVAWPCQMKGRGKGLHFIRACTEIKWSLFCYFSQKYTEKIYNSWDKNVQLLKWYFNIEVLHVPVWTSDLFLKVKVGFEVSLSALWMKERLFWALNPVLG